MRIYLVDDRGQNGEYLAFIHAYRGQMPEYTMDVFTHWQPMFDAIIKNPPDLILADMRFDLVTREQLYGDIDALANSEHFGGNYERAEAQVRGMQGLLISRALRDNHISVPIILFASLAPKVEQNVIQKLAPIRIIKGLILEEILQAMRELVPEWMHGK